MDLAVARADASLSVWRVQELFAGVNWVLSREIGMFAEELRVGLSALDQCVPLPPLRYGRRILGNRRS